MYACLYQSDVSDRDALVGIASDFSPRFERHGGNLVSIDIRGLERLFGSTREIARALRRDAARRGLRVQVAIAGTQTAARVLAEAHSGVTVVERGGEAEALADVPIGILEDVGGAVVAVLRTWGIKTLGELAALPADDLAARLGGGGLVCQAIARGIDRRPLVPELPEERFEGTLELEWPIDTLEPLSFVLTRLLEPLSIRLERRDRGAAIIHTWLKLVADPNVYARRLELPSPIRDVRTLRTLALLDLESHPPPAAVEAVTVNIEPTPGRVLQHALFVRAHPTAEQISTLLARLGALMGQDRIGAPATVDSYRPGAFEMRPFAAEHDFSERREGGARGGSASSASSANSTCAVSLRRCREPVPARVVVAGGRPVRVTTDRRGFAGGVVVQAAGPWKTSGHWWAGRAGRAGEGNAFPLPPIQPLPPILPYWNREEWDVAVSDGAVYRIFQDRETDRWFIEAMVD